jgi:ectoine hydroxylase-related dioxygenase (phytanoyl-CoA dioxygenase family)
MDSIKQFFDTNGYFIVRGLFTQEECTAFKAEIGRLLETHKHHGGVFVGLAVNSPVFREAARHARLLDALEAALGPNIEFLSDKVVFKSASVDYGSPWHQDWPYWQGINKVSVWIALDTATPENGCLKLMPGSHKSLAVHDGVDEEGVGFGHRLSPDAVDESLAVIAPCEPGDAILFHDMTLHSSFPNSTGQDRWALISTYRSVSEPDKEYEWAVAAEIVRGRRAYAESNS